MKTNTPLTTLSFALGALAFVSQGLAQTREGKLDRTVLPILKVTVDVKPVGAAVRAEADSGERMARVRKALSD